LTNTHDEIVRGEIQKTPKIHQGKKLNLNGDYALTNQIGSLGGDKKEAPLE